ncbi:MAG: hypothetical protein J7J91_09960 [Deltaproteobacteria bacterium]|nr:hypothetical protein [Deltaproteobacteria bacterium]
MGKVDEKEKIHRKIMEIIVEAYINNKMTLAEIIGMLEVLKTGVIDAGKEIAEVNKKHKKTKKNRP